MYSFLGILFSQAIKMALVLNLITLANHYKIFVKKDVLIVS